MEKNIEGERARANLMKNKLNQCNAQTMESSADDEEEFQNRCKWKINRKIEINCDAHTEHSEIDVVEGHSLDIAFKYLRLTSVEHIQQT